MKHRIIRNRINTQPSILYPLTILYLHTGAVMRDLTVEQYPTQKDLHSSHCIKDTTSDTQNTTRMQPPTYVIIVQ